MVKKANRIPLRPAEEVRKEVAESASFLERERLEQKLSYIAGRIEGDKEKGYIYEQALPAGVVKALQSKGYAVAYFKATHSGDVDSHKISW
jgi:hypothetical protein